MPFFANPDGLRAPPDQTVLKLLIEFDNRGGRPEIRYRPTATGRAHTERPWVLLSCPREIPACRDKQTEELWRYGRFHRPECLWEPRSIKWNLVFHFWEVAIYFVR